MVKRLLAVEVSPLAALRDPEENHVTFLRCSPLLDKRDPKSLLGVFSIARDFEDGKFGQQFVAVRNVSIRGISDPISHSELIRCLRFLDAPNGYLNSYLDAAIVFSPPYNKFGDGGSDVSIAGLNWLIGTKITGDGNIPMGAVLFIIVFNQKMTCRLPSMFSACVRLSNLEWGLGDIVLMTHGSVDDDALWKVAPRQGKSGFIIRQSSLDMRRPRKKKLLIEQLANEQPYFGLFDV